MSSNKPSGKKRSSKQSSSIVLPGGSGISSFIGMNPIENRSTDVDVKEKYSKVQQEEQIYDSGVLSEVNIASEQFLSGEIDDPSSKTPRAPPPQQPSYEKSTSCKEMLVTLDSGIDIEVTDQFSSSNVDYSDASYDKTYSSADVYSSSSSTKPQQKSKSKVGESEQSPSFGQSTSEPYPWQLYFIQDDDGNTQLHIAILEGYTEAVYALLRLVPDSRYLDIRNDYCQTGLHLSVLTNQPQLVRQLLLSGVDASIVDRFGNTALHLACKINSVECVVALLESVTDEEKKQIPPYFNPRMDSLDYLNEYNYDGVTCVHIATQCKNIHILHQLLIRGAGVNIRECKAGYTALHEAVSSGDERFVYYLLQHSDIDLEKETYSRLTPYQLSSQYPRISKMLLEKGAIPLPFADEADEESDDDDDVIDDGEVELNNVTNLIRDLNTGNARVIVTSC